MKSYKKTPSLCIWVSSVNTYSRRPRCNTTDPENWSTSCVILGFRVFQNCQDVLQNICWICPSAFGRAVREPAAPQLTLKISCCCGNELQKNNFASATGHISPYTHFLHIISRLILWRVSCAVFVAVLDSFITVVKSSELPHPDMKQAWGEAVPLREKPLPRELCWNLHFIPVLVLVVVVVGGRSC